MGGWAEELLAALPYGWRLQLEARAPDARLASLAGLALVLCGAARWRGGVVSVRDLTRDANGKPRFTSGPYFSLSHATTRVAAVVTRRCEVGLDLEAVGDASPTRDLHRWTATEATLKAAGLGLRSVAEVAVDASGSSAFLRGRRYDVAELKLAPDVVASLASEVPLQLQSMELRLDSTELSTTIERSLRLATQV